MINHCLAILSHNITCLIDTFQCDHTDYDENTSTIHMLSHYCGASPEGIWQDFMTWIPRNMQFMRQASGYLLKKKNLDLQPYLQYLINPQFKFDEIAILLFTRMYQIHVGVILKGRYWSTHRQQSIENFECSNIILVYYRDLNFKETVVRYITADTIELLTPSCIQQK